MAFFFSLVTVGSVVTLSGCGGYCGFGGDNKNSTYRIDNVNANLVRVAGISESIYGNAFYNVESFPNGSTSSTYDSIGFDISFDYVSAFIQEKTALPFMMNSAYACSEPDPYLVDNIVSINIKSDADYDNLHQAGTSLNDVFVISIGSDFTYSIDEYIDKIIGRSYPYYYNMLLMMSVAPEFEGTHTFTIDITLEDGKVLSEQLDPVTIKI